MKQRTLTAQDYLRRHTSEHRLQASVLRFLEVHAVRNTYVFAIPNEAKRSFTLAARMKASGLRAGVADLCIMFPEGRVAWLELKTLKGRQTPEQKNFEEVCDVLGHRYGLAHSLDEAIDILKRWGALK